MRNWFKSGEPWVWLNAAAVSACLIVVVGLLMLIASRGLGHFWPSPVMALSYQLPGQPAEAIIAEPNDIEVVNADLLREAGVALDPSVEDAERHLVKVGNRDILGGDFRWLIADYMKDVRYPENMIALERREWGNFYGYLRSVKDQDVIVAEGDDAWPALESRLARALSLHDEIRHIEKSDIGAVNYALERLRLKQRGLELDNALTPERLKALNTQRQAHRLEYKKLQTRLNTLYKEIRRDSLTAEIGNGQMIVIPLEKIVRAYRPNAMSFLSRLYFYFAKVWEFISDEPREANTEGGIFPAIFGTVMLVLIMSVFVTPFGVIAAVYLREYAKQGPLTRTIRIAVNNLAGVPSIVYGVFGLGFFVYFLGGNIDALFFPEALPAPTFGTSGILWSSLTLAILTVPVVIVATEEGLSRIPRAIREGSLALGATKAETLWRTVLPMATPAMMTGLILAVARAAGEVAPLMLVGVVKLAPSLPLDGNMPFLHLDRKFMHLGFHIYDVGFQSPNVEAARPLVYATALLLVLVIVVLNLAAIWIRNRLRERYRALES
jgi:phosphate transport system permease protein